LNESREISGLLFIIIELLKFDFWVSRERFM
jgi:hypothetical protein